MYILTQNGLNIIGVNSKSKITIDDKGTMPRIVLLDNDCRSVLGIYQPEEAVRVLKDLFAALDTEKSFRMPLSGRYSNGHVLTGDDIDRLCSKMFVSVHAKKRLYERGLFKYPTAIDDILNKLKSIVRSNESFFDKDGSVIVKVDSDHYLVFTYDYVRNGYVLATYTEQSLYNFTFEDKREKASKA